MNDQTISPDDPRLTAYALDELDATERATVEAALRENPTLQAMVDEIRAAAGRVSAALAAEPAPEPAHLEPYRTVRPARILRFPYWAVAGLAAACFAVILSVRQIGERRNRESGALLSKQAGAEKMEQADKPAPMTKPGDEHIIELALDQERQEATVQPRPAPAAENAARPRALSATNEQKPDSSVAAISLPPSVAPVPAEGVLSEPPKRTDDSKVINGVPPVGPVAASMASPPVVAASKAEEVVKLSPFEVSSERDAGYTATNTLAGSRLDTGTTAPPLAQVERGTAAAASGAREFYAPPLFSGTPRPLEGDGRDQLFEGVTGRIVLPPSRTGFNTEAYDRIVDNDFLAVAGNPLSTFSVDVDTASYSNVRRFLLGGRLPPKDAVRIEELLNYFTYNYATPKENEAPFATTIEAASAPWEPSHRLVRIGLKGRELSDAARPAANLVFLLDVSGSMRPANKLPLVKESLRMLVDKLRPGDRVAMVVYAGASGMALPSTPAGRKDEILDALDRLAAGGSTNGAMGIHLAYDIAKANFVSGGANRVILATDGDFNVGVTNRGDLLRLIEEKAKTGVFLTVLGFGMGNIKDATLEQLADKGNGSYAYIDSAREARKVLVEQAAGTLAVIAKDVKVQVEFNPAHVQAYRLIGYENRLLKKEDFNNDRIDAGEIGAGHTVTALYEVVPAGVEWKAESTVDPLKYQTVTNPKSKTRNPKSGELLTVKLRYKAPDGDTSRLLEFPFTDSGADFADASADFKFAAAVAGFGMVLRDSPHKGAATLAEIVRWANEGTGSDPGGYRGEFVQLVRRAENILPRQG